MQYQREVPVKQTIPFDLKVGDKVTFLVENHWNVGNNGHNSNGHSTMMREVVGEVESISTHTFMAKYESGFATLRQSLIKTDYQTGEVRRYYEETE